MSKHIRKVKRQSQLTKKPPLRSIKANILFRIERDSIEMQIIYMDKRFKGHSYSAPSGIHLHSQNCPALAESAIYLQGSSPEHDQRVCMYSCNSPNIDFSNMIEALHSWAANWDGWEILPEPKEYITAPMYLTHGWIQRFFR